MHKEEKQDISVIIPEPFLSSGFCVPQSQCCRGNPTNQQGRLLGQSSGSVSTPSPPRLYHRFQSAKSHDSLFLLLLLQRDEEMRQKEESIRVEQERQEAERERRDMEERQSKERERIARERAQQIEQEKWVRHTKHKITETHEEDTSSILCFRLRQKQREDEEREQEQQRRVSSASAHWSWFGWVYEPSQHHITAPDRLKINQIWKTKVYLITNNIKNNIQHYYLTPFKKSYKHK